MTSKANIIRAPKKHKVTNWSEYNKALKQRVNLEIWISNDIEET